MILYQIAKELEERAHLDRTIRETGGDESLASEKAMIEQSLMDKALRWQQAEEVIF